MTRGGHHPIGDDIHRKASHYQSPTDKLNRTHSNSPPGAMQSLAIAPAAGLTLHMRAQCTVLRATQSFQSLKLIFLKRETTEASYCTLYTCYMTRSSLSSDRTAGMFDVCPKVSKVRNTPAPPNRDFQWPRRIPEVKIGAPHPQDRLASTFGLRSTPCRLRVPARRRGFDLILTQFDKTTLVAATPRLVSWRR